MIRKLENGNTLVTLGEGTVYSGNVSSEGDNKPFGIYFSNNKEKSKEAVIIQLSGMSGIASYTMALVRYLETHSNEDMVQFHETIEKLKATLKPLLPIEKDQIKESK